MNTIIDYIKTYGDYTFYEKPLNDVDSLALSQFSYLKFDALVPGIEDGKEAVDMQYLLKHKDYDRLYGDERYREKNTALFLAMADSIRFGKLRMNNYVNQIEPDRETQFSAITYELPDNIYYIAYRGTDETMVGWKEDLNLAFSEPVPGQLMSIDYLNRTAKDINSPFYVGGHSKGGNFAIYAAMNCNKDIQDRIAAVFDHDGPGFRPEVREKCGFNKIKDRLRKTIPHSSLVGMILYSEGAYRVVESKNLGLAQHDPFSWLTDGDDFLVVKQIYPSRMFINTAMNEWILSLNQEQMRVFVDTLYEVLAASDADNLIDFTANWQRSIKGIMEAIKNVDSDTMQLMNNIMKALFDMISQHAKDEFHIEQRFKK